MRPDLPEPHDAVNRDFDDDHPWDRRRWREITSRVAALSLIYACRIAQHGGDSLQSEPLVSGCLANRYTTTRVSDDILGFYPRIDGHDPGQAGWAVPGKANRRGMDGTIRPDGGEGSNVRRGQDALCGPRQPYRLSLIRRAHIRHWEPGFRTSDWRNPAELELHRPREQTAWLASDFLGDAPKLAWSNP